jgi:hypothetical protein
MFRRFGVTGGLIGILTAGCALKAPITQRGEGIYPGAAIRAGIEYADYSTNLSPKLERTQSEDGIAETDLNGAADEEYKLVPKLGIESSIGTNNLRFIGGIDGRYHFLSEAEEEGIYDEATTGNSTAFTQLTPDEFSHYLFIGAEAKISSALISLEYGWPGWGFEWEKGRAGKEANVTEFSDSWSGTGEAFGANLMIKTGKNDYAGVGWRREKYDAEFAGENAEIKADYFMIQGARKF